VYLKKKNTAMWSTYSTSPLTSKSLPNVAASWVDDRMGFLETRLTFLPVNVIFV